MAGFGFGGPGGPGGPGGSGERRGSGGHGPGGPEKEFNLEQMDQEMEEMLRTRFLTRENAVFERTGGGFLKLQVEGEGYSRVSVVRMFPFREKERYLSVRTTDERSREIGIVKDLNDFPEDVRKMLLEQLDLRYFTPVITKVISIKDEFGYSYWEVMTDHGACRFTVRMGGNSIVHLSDVRILVMDIDENRFEIPDLEKLSSAERKKLDLFI